MAAAQDGRKVREQVQPVYPEMAKSMNLTGSVKVQISVTPQGIVRDAKVIGGHPLLADAAMRAVKNWKYDPGIEETKIIIFEFKKPN